MATTAERTVLLGTKGLFADFRAKTQKRNCLQASSGHLALARVIF
jgi:hypothetical protein